MPEIRRCLFPAMKTIFVFLAVFAVAVSACGGGGDSGTAPAVVLAGTPDGEPAPPATAPAPRAQITAPAAPGPAAAPTAAPEPAAAPTAAPEPAQAPTAGAVSGPTPAPTAALFPEEPEDAVCGPAGVAVDTDGDGVLDDCLEDFALNLTPDPTAKPDPVVQPTPEPTAKPDPVVQPTPEPTAKPDPVAAPTPEPTPAPTAKADPVAAPTPEPTAKATPVAEPTPEAVHVYSGWHLDPTCRNDYRWWSGLRWTEDVSNPGSGSEDGPDPLQAGEDHGPPSDEQQQRCEEATAAPQPIVVADYSTVCADPAPAGEPGLGTGSDGGPCAVRLLTRGDLLATGLFDVGPPGSPAGGRGLLLQRADSMPNVPDAEALAHVTECVRAEPPGGYPGASGKARMPDEATTFQACNVLWQLAAGPINHAGMRPEARCVYETFILFHLMGVYSLDHTPGDWQRYGWGDVCYSWIDPEPDRPFLEKCHWLYGHYIGQKEAAGRIWAYDQCRAYTDNDTTAEWLAARGNCGDRYLLVLMANLFMHREARELGLLPDNEGTVDYLTRRPADATGAYRLC